MQGTRRFGGAAILASLMLVVLAGMGSALAEVENDVAFNPTGYNTQFTLENSIYFDTCIIDNEGIYLYDAWLSSPSETVNNSIYISLLQSDNTLMITYLDNHNLKFQVSDNETSQIFMIAPEPYWVKNQNRLLTEVATKTAFDAEASSCWYYDNDNLWIQVDAENYDNIVLISWVYVTLTFDSTPEANSTMTIVGTTVDDNGTSVEPIDNVYVYDSLTGLHNSIAVENNTFTVSWATPSQVGASGQIYAYGVGSLWESETSSYTIQSATSPPDQPGGLILPPSSSGDVAPAEIPPEAPPVAPPPEVPVEISPQVIIAVVLVAFVVAAMVTKRIGWW